MQIRPSTRRLAVAGLITALYAGLTLCLPAISYGLVQCRVAEALTVLAAITPAAIPGLMVGCALSNLLGVGMGANVAGMLDILLGPLATGLAAYLTWRLRARRVGGLPLWSVLPPVVINALVVGTELTVVSPHFSWGAWLIQMGLVAAGEAVACFAGGLLLYKMLEITGLDRRIGGKP